jgi:uncharacterized protein (TIGR03435 family)
MNRREKSEILDRTLGLFNEPSPERMEEARANVLRRLKSKNEGLDADATLASDPGHIGRSPRWAVAAAIVIVVLLPAAMFWYGRTPGSLQSADGVHKLTYGEMVRSNDSEVAVVTLRDGSRVEMRSKSELALEKAGDGVRIRLNRGSVIVTAAKQPTGHLYVQTRDVDVSVIGTVFLVNAEEEGSRVAVIEGEVHVQQRASSEKLLPGEQVATNPSMDSRTLREEIAWSRNAETHLALLRQSLPAPISISRSISFAVASIKPHSGSSDGIESLGFVCHGVDGARRAFPEDIGLGGRLIAALGRCRGNGVLLQSLIAFAYGVPNRDVVGVPDWATPSAIGAGPGQAAVAFQIDGEAEDPAMTTTDQLRRMLESMLADRFKVRMHREIREESGYALVIAKNGPKQTLKKVSTQEELPILDTGSNGQPVIRGRSTMSRLTQFLNGSLGVGGANLPVVDKTGLEGIYEYEINRMISGPRGGAPAGETPRPSLEELQRLRTESLSDAMEAQLGIRLQPDKNIPVEVIVIEHVERPSPN